MSKALLSLSAALATVAVHAAAVGQEAIPKENGYRLAGKSSDASYFVSGIQRGAEPESVEAWIWTVTPSPAGADSEQYDAKAQWSVLRCSGVSIEAIRQEFYLRGEFVKAVELPPKIPADVKKDTPMQPVWSVACNSAFRFNARFVADIGEVYHIAQGD